MRPIWIPFLYLSPQNAFVTAGLTPRDQPWPSSNNILDYVDPTIYNTGGDDKCSSIITADGNEPYLAFPNARIVHQSSGTIDCQTRLRLAASQTGYRFSVNWVSLSGYLRLEPGAYIERVNVALGYFPGGKQVSFHTHGTAIRVDTCLTSADGRRKRK